MVVCNKHALAQVGSKSDLCRESSIRSLNGLLVSPVLALLLGVPSTIRAHCRLMLLLLLLLLPCGLALKKRRLVFCCFHRDSF